MEKHIEQKDYRAELHKMFSNFDFYFDTPHKRKVGKSYRNFYLSVMQIIDDADLKRLYESLMAGDPKLRNLRAIYQSVYTKYVNISKVEQKERNGNG